MSDVQVLDRYQAADFLQMKSQRLIRIAKAGELPFIDLGDGELRFLLTDLVAYVQAHRHLPASEVARA